jgi:hypothetical protein
MSPSASLCGSRRNFAFGGFFGGREILINQKRLHDGENQPDNDERDKERPVVE